MQNLQALKTKALSLPLKPGVYIMKDKSGQVIYVGKAKALKNRVSSYFSGLSSHTQKTLAMVLSVFEFDTIITKTEFEALVLECSLIKRHKPKYNILLKDGKGYPFIRLSVADEYPRFSVVNKKKNDKARYFGPYFGGMGTTKRVVHTLLDILKLPSCGKLFPRDLNKFRPCLNKHLGKCAAPCNLGISAKEYREVIDQAVLLLQGKQKDLETNLKKQMLEASERLEFERAAMLRDKHRAVAGLAKNQTVISSALADTDVFGVCTDTARPAVAVLHYIDGVLLARDLQVLSAGVFQEGGEILAGFMVQYYQNRKIAPKNIILSEQISDREAVCEFIAQATGTTPNFMVPQRGEKKALAQLACINAREEAVRVTTTAEKESKTLLDFAAMLGLETPPKRIEAYDVSNTAGSDNVGCMVVYTDGRADKKEYRKFKIKGIEGQDDYYSIGEMIKRRFDHIDDPEFGQVPDLLLIDGGKAHCSVVCKALEQIGANVAVLGMVKNNRHVVRALTNREGLEINLDAKPHVFAFVGKISEENHRFAISYHRQLRQKSVKYSVLDNIPSVGKERKRKLLARFKSLETMKKATVEELAQVVPKSCAQQVFEYFRGDM